LTDVLVVTLREVELVLELDFAVVGVGEVVRRCTGSPNPYRSTGSGNPYFNGALRRNRFCFADSSASIIILRLTNRSMERAYSNMNEELKLTFRTIGISTTCFAAGKTAVGNVFLL
jgi:hypothetical protein